MERKISDIVRDNYEIAIPYINKRTIPNFYDGLKPSQLRTIFSMMRIASKKKVKVASIAGDCLAHYHPHGDQSIVDVVVDLVNKGIIQGRGNFGTKYLYKNDDDAAAPRYIEAGLSESFVELTNTLLKYCKMEESEVDGSLVPTSLYFPIPIAAITGSRGLGLAANTNIPAFTAKSLLAAMKADDYHLLESSYGVQIVNEESTIRKIWEQGHGKITYRMKVYKGRYGDMNGVFMEGDARLFGHLNLWPFRKARREGQVVLMDVDYKTLFIGKQVNIRKIDVDWIYQQCLRIRDVSEVYMITLNKDGSTGRSPLKYWIKSVYDRYVECYKKYVADKISDKKSQILIYSNMREVGKRLIKRVPHKDISKELNIPEWVITEITKKSIGMLEKDHSNTVNKLKSEIKDLESLDIIKSVDKLIDKL